MVLLLNGRPCRESIDQMHNQIEIFYREISSLITSKSQLKHEVELLKQPEKKGKLKGRIIKYQALWGISSNI